MASYNYTGNNLFMSLQREGGQPVVVHSVFKSITYNFSTDTVDTTRGSGAQYKSRNAALRDCTIDAEFGYVTPEAAEQLRTFGTGQEVYIISGPEGAIPGKPRHSGGFIIASLSFDQTVSKEEILLSVSLEQSEAPDCDMQNGGVF